MNRETVDRYNGLLELILSAPSPAMALLHAISKEAELARRQWVSEIDKARFWSKVDMSYNCWLWTGSKSSDGYGRFGLNGKSVAAHRLAYGIVSGEMPTEQVLHRCDNPPCVNPDHLKTGTHKDNMMDMMKRGRHRKKNATSKYRGVSWREDSNKWRAVISKDGKNVSGGSWITELDAAIAYDELAKELFGDNADLNFPPESP